MYIVPFGEVKEDRFQLSKKYYLIEMIAGFYRLTEKCKKNYEPLSYIKYLQGKVEKPEKVSQIKKDSKVKKATADILSPKKLVIEQLISM